MAGGHGVAQHAGFGGGDLHFHLHGFHHGDELAGLHGGAVFGFPGVERGGGGGGDGAFVCLLIGWPASLPVRFCARLRAAGGQGGQQGGGQGQGVAAAVDFDGQAQQGGAGRFGAGSGQAGQLVGKAGFDPAGVHGEVFGVFGAEGGRLEHGAVKGQHAGHAFDVEFGQGAARARQRLGAGGRPDDEFGHHRVELRGDERAALHAAVDAHAGAAGRRKGGDAAGHGQKAARHVFGVDAKFNGVAARGRFVRHGQGQAVGDAQLFDNEVASGGFFGDGVLHLQARVHFQKGDGAAAADEKFRRACAHVARAGADVARGLVQALALCVAQERGGGFFHELLVAPLQGAVTRAEDGDAPVRVGHDLHFHMARLVQVLLHEAFAPAKGGGGFAHGGVIQLGHFFHVPGHFQAAPAAAKGGFDGDGQAVFTGKGQHLLRVLHGAGGAGHQRRARLLRNLAGRDFVAQAGDGFGRRADPLQPRIDDGLRKVGVFGEKAVAGVHGVGAALAGDADQLVNVQIGVGGALAVQRPGFSGQARVRRVDVGVGIDGHGCHAVVGAGADDADGDFAPVGDEDFFHERQIS